MTAAINVHATALELDGMGLLLRGPSGSGKSLLALALLDRWEGRLLSAVLVADDRVDLRREASQVLMSPPAVLAGLVELRGRGIVRRSYRCDVRLHLVVDLVPELVRMPDPSAFCVDLLGVSLARAPVPVAVDVVHQVLLVNQALTEHKRP